MVVVCVYFFYVNSYKEPVTFAPVLSDDVSSSSNDSFAGEGLMNPAIPDGIVRIDTGVFEGGTISMYYDPMIAKLCTHASNRSEQKKINALCHYFIIQHKRINNMITQKRCHQADGGCARHICYQWSW